MEAIEVDLILRKYSVSIFRLKNSLKLLSFASFEAEVSKIENFDSQK